MAVNLEVYQLGAPNRVEPIKVATFDARARLLGSWSRHDCASCTRIAICTRFATASLVRRRETCALTVASLMNRDAATSALDAPDPTAVATSRSRSVSDVGAGQRDDGDLSFRRCRGEREVCG